MLVEESAGFMWTGHENGSVACWQLLQDRPAQFHHSWSAHQLGHVTTLMRTHYGELWTGSAVGGWRGSRLPHAQAQARINVLVCSTAAG
jgi:ligand-binding sensor domain-containing protein